MKVILIGKDSHFCEEFISGIAQWNWKVEQALLDAQALPKVRAGAEARVLLVDWDVSEAERLRVGDWLKGQKDTEQTYVVLVGTEYEFNDISSAAGRIADDFMAKPVKKTELYNRLILASRFLGFQQLLRHTNEELAAAKIELQRLLAADDATGLPNRRDFMERLTEEWRRSLREEYPLSLLMLDIDFFRHYNDSEGHWAGDKCLRTISRILTDTISRAGDFAARYGGEEFVLLLPGTDRIGALVVAEAIRVSIAKLGLAYGASESRRNLTVSLGTATLTPRTDLDSGALLLQAEQALGQAKAAGRNVVRQNAAAE